MKVDIVMPKMGESIYEGTLIKWHKNIGDRVKKDEIIYEISTDKVDTEIPSPEDGVLTEIRVLEQDTVAVGTVVAIIETNGVQVESKSEELKKEVQTAKQVDNEVIEIPMPKMGESVMEGTIIKWHKKVGDKVKQDEIIFEISTDKVDTEVPSPVDGTLEEILFVENDTVAVGVTVAKISTGNISASTQTKPTSIEPAKEKKLDNSIPQTTNNKQLIANNSQLTNKFYSPLVLNIARAEGISIDELELIQGTGIGGRLTKNDLLNYIQKGRSGATTTSNVGIMKTDKVQRVEIMPMDNTRQRIMEHMIKSKDISVHVTAVTEVDVSKIHYFLEKNRDSFSKEGVKLTYLSFIAFTVVKALKEFSLMNASIDGKNILIKKYVNLGIAVAVEPNGLIVPNIKKADEKNVRGLAKSIADIGNRARTKKLVPEDTMDGTFTITNYGVFGSLFGTPIINQPEVGVLGVGAVTKKPVVIESGGLDSIAIKPMMYLSLSHDHRLVDGMLGGKFLNFVKNTLENFDISII